MSREAKPYKFGAFVDGAGWVEHCYGNCFARRGDALVAAPDRDQIRLMRALLPLLSVPLAVTYELLISLDELQEGNYCLDSLPCPNVASLLDRYRPLLEEDGRQNLTIASASVEASICFDEHNLITLTGPLAQFEGVLLESGLHEGAIEMPSPHSHHHHEEFDSLVRRLFASYPWRKC